MCVCMRARAHMYVYECVGAWVSERERERDLCMFSSGCLTVLLPVSSPQLEGSFKCTPKV